MTGRPPPRFQSDQRLGFGPCKAETRTGRPCTNYAVGKDGRCRMHRKRRKVKRKVGTGYIGGVHAFVLGPWDVFATDWELYETPDSPCDVP